MSDDLDSVLGSAEITTLPVKLSYRCPSELPGTSNCAAKIKLSLGVTVGVDHLGLVPV